MRAWAWFWIAVVAMVMAVLPEAAICADLVPPTQAGRDALIAKIDRGRIGIVTGTPGGIYTTLGSDMASLVESVKGEELRVIVMQSRGSVRNLLDLAFLKNTDLALVQADVLNYLQQHNPADFQYLNDRLAYVARLHHEVIHVVARGGPFTKPQDIAGKTIAMGAPDSGMHITAPIVLNDILDLHVKLVDMDQKEAFSNLLSDKPSIDGFVYITGKGAPLFSGLSPEKAKRIIDKQIYIVPFPDPPAVGGEYLSETLTDKIYPSLIAPNQTVPVWAVPAVLAVYDWNKRSAVDHTGLSAARAARIENFVNVLFDNRLKLDDHPLNGDGNGRYDINWCAVDLANTVPGWKRIKVADDWLATHPQEQTAICGAAASAPASGLSCPAFLQSMKDTGITLPDPNISSELLFRNWQSTHPGRC